ncbi:MAG: helix-turn-helix transcriptional regulator [Treponema sp.]|nr:helix-turn-helix transcriptional regulator [Treponema sp.]
MCRNNNLLENVLVEIEKGVREGINTNILAQKYALSESHLRKIFKIAFKQTISSYIRTRKLTASLEDLSESDANIIDIALMYDFDYEQSYIRSFKQKFGSTPGNYRRSKKVIKANMPFFIDFDY